jgi:hypothetical protein
MTNKEKLYIKMAIQSWLDKANGFYKWYEKERYSREYCFKQILYFQDLKL